MYSRILVPLDGTPLAEAIVPHAVEVAKKFDATLVLLRAITSREDIVRQTTTPEPMAMASLSVDLTTEVLDAEVETARKYLNSIGERLKAQGVRIESLIAEGEPAMVLEQAIKAQKIDLVAMATHGRSTLGRLLHGSVAESVLRDVDIPVLLVHAKG